MTFQGIIFICLISATLFIWVLDLVRKGKLYVGYGIIFLTAALGIAATVSIPSLLEAITYFVGAVYAASALTLLALCFIAVMLIYILGQLTIISNRLSTLVQELAIQEAKGSTCEAPGQTPETSGSAKG